MDAEEEAFDINNFEGEQAWDEGDQAPYFDLVRGLYEVGGVHYFQYDSGFEDDESEDDENENEEEENDDENIENEEETGEETGEETVEETREVNVNIEENTE